MGVWVSMEGCEDGCGRGQQAMESVGSAMVVLMFGWRCGQWAKEPVGIAVGSAMGSGR